MLRAVRRRAEKTYIETRIQLYQELKVELSMSLLPDTYFVVRVIERANQQVYFWRRCIEVNGEMIPFTDYRWKWCEKQELFVPTWFNGNHFPPSLRRKRHAKAKDADEADDRDAFGQNDPQQQRQSTNEREPLAQKGQSTGPGEAPL